MYLFELCWWAYCMTRIKSSQHHCCIHQGKYLLLFGNSTGNSQTDSNMVVIFARNVKVGSGICLISFRTCSARQFFDCGIPLVGFWICCHFDRYKCISCYYIVCQSSCFLHLMFFLWLFTIDVFFYNLHIICNLDIPKSYRIWFLSADFCGIKTDIMSDSNFDCIQWLLCCWYFVKTLLIFISKLADTLQFI